MNQELAITKGGYMSRRLFNEGIDMQTRSSIQTTYPLPEWEWARRHVDEKHTISTSAIQLSKRVKEELNIDVFPLIITVAIKGWASTGQCQFKMFGKSEYETYYFDLPRSRYNKKSAKLEIDTDRSGDNVITIQ